mgnify:CR=1 FL=1
MTAVVVVFVVPVAMVPTDSTVGRGAHPTALRVEDIVVLLTTVVLVV